MESELDTDRFRVQLKSGAHTPLLYLLFPLLFGFALATNFPDFQPTLPTITLVVALAAGLTFFAQRMQSRAALFIWGGIFCSTVTLAAWLYYVKRVPPAPDLAQMVSREANIPIEVERVFALRSKSLRVAGIGRMTEGPKYAPELRGQLIYFHCWKDGVDQNVGRGSVIRVKGKLEPTPIDPNGFDGYLRQQGCYLKLSQASLKEVVQLQPWLYRKFSQINGTWQSQLQNGANSPRTRQLAGIATAMFLGEKAALTVEQKERFIASGTMHLFAVSGLHVGIVGGLLAVALRAMRIPRKLRPFIGLALLMGYVQVTGAAPSAIRAWWMAFFFWSAYGLMRKPQPLSALAGSAMVVLLIDPRQMWSAGFQLSYTVVAGLLIYGAPLQDWLQQRFEPWRHIFPESRSRAQRLIRASVKTILGLLAISFAASLYSTPLAVRYFEVLAPGAFLLNIPLIALAPLAMTASLLSVLLGWLGWAAASAFANHASWIFIAGMDALVRGFLRTPESSLMLGWRWPGGGYTLALCMLAAALLLADKRTPVWARFGIPPVMMLLGLVFGTEMRQIS